MAADPYGYLRSCSACSAHLLTYASADRDAPALCRKCEPGLMTAEEILAQPHPRFSLYSGRNSTEYVLLFREGDKLVVRRMGFPDEPSFETTVSMVRPQFSYAKLTREKARLARERSTAKAGARRAR